MSSEIDLNQIVLSADKAEVLREITAALRPALEHLRKRGFELPIRLEQKGVLDGMGGLRIKLLLPNFLEISLFVSSEGWGYNKN